uniref:Uncharacterized protein n=1 Tax=Arion vulgaris TaxID=1028688 RepID=A0A0B7A0K1_9EUPU
MLTIRADMLTIRADMLTIRADMLTIRFFNENHIGHSLTGFEFLNRTRKESGKVDILNKPGV